MTSKAARSAPPSWSVPPQPANSATRRSPTTAPTPWLSRGKWRPRRTAASRGSTAVATAPPANPAPQFEIVTHDITHQSTNPAAAPPARRATLVIVWTMRKAKSLGSLANDARLVQPGRLRAAPGLTRGPIVERPTAPRGAAALLLPYLVALTTPDPLWRPWPMFQPTCPNRPLLAARSFS
jgi:hypothetical protein